MSTTDLKASCHYFHFFGSLSHCPVSQTTVWLNMFVLCFYRKDTFQVWNGPACHCRDPWSLSGSIQKTKDVSVYKGWNEEKHRRNTAFLEIRDKYSLFWTNVYSVCHPVSQGTFVDLRGVQRKQQSLGSLSYKKTIENIVCVFIREEWNSKLCGTVSSVHMHIWYTIYHKQQRNVGLSEAFVLSVMNTSKERYFRQWYPNHW